PDFCIYLITKWLQKSRRDFEGAFKKSAYLELRSNRGVALRSQCRLQYLPSRVARKRRHDVDLTRHFIVREAFAQVADEFAFVEGRAFAQGHVSDRLLAFALVRTTDHR